VSDLNPHCDGDHCRDPKGETRLYPMGGGENLVLCLSCFAHENGARLQCGDTRPQVNWANAIMLKRRLTYKALIA